MIPDSVTSIEDGTFQGCSALTTIEIPNSVTSIGDWAFGECYTLTSIEIPESVDSIGENAFYGCSRITSIKIPDSVTTIGDEAFAYCPKLHSITIGTGVQSISNSVFYGSSPEKVIWLCNTPPSGYSYAAGEVNYVANESFKMLDNALVYPYLSSIFETGGIRYVPISPSERTCAAIDCAYDSTSTLRIGKTVNYQGIEMSIEAIGPYACYDNDSTNNLIVEGFKGSIGYHAFHDCDSLTGIEISDTVKSIGSSAFEGCQSLQYAHINTFGDVGNNCFKDCTALTDADIYATGSLGDNCLDGCTALAAIHLGAGITELGSECFQNCTALTEITIPASVNKIWNYAFAGCSALNNVTIADRNSELEISSNGRNPLFVDCPLNTVYIGGNISYPTDSYNGYSPFYRNTSLETVTITDRETEISENEFYGCTNLKNVTLGDDIKHIGNYAFSGCSSLTNFTFGSSMESIGEEAFSDCTAMERLTSYTINPPVCGAQALDDINKWTCKLYVPTIALDAYKAADQWKDFFYISTGITNVADNAGSTNRLLEGRVQVFNLSGRLLKVVEKASSVQNVLQGMNPGLYLLKGSGVTLKMACP